MQKRMLRRHLSTSSFILSIVFVALLPVSASAVDSKGKFAVEGVGSLNCEQYIAARNAESADYNRLLGWLEGFASAANLYERGTFDITPWQTTGVLAVIVANHCRKNPKDQYAFVVQRLLSTFMEKRLPAQSPTVEATASEQTARIYEDVLRKAQIALAKKGLYRSLPNGRYNEKTQQAFASFQEQSGLEVTGLPDQVTLWRLFEP